VPLWEPRYCNTGSYSEDTWHRYCMEAAERAIGDGQIQLARDVALGWAAEVADRIGIATPTVWKFFKRSLVSVWFGSRPHKQFMPGWSTESALSYALSLSGVSVRLSEFPKGIACHARSHRLDGTSREDWRGIIEHVDHNQAVEVFPEAGGEGWTCFRFFSTAFHEAAFCECGYGQAMQVFEEEVGLHAIARACLEKGHWRLESSSDPPVGSRPDFSGSLQHDLMRLLDGVGDELLHKSFCICRKLGIDQVALEGYYSAAAGEAVRVVDLDLPLDVAFMQKDPASDD